MPALGDPGTIIKAKQVLTVTGGHGYIHNPQQVTYLPPIPYAWPNLTIYAQETEANHAVLRGDAVEVRCAFTTEKLDSKLVQEIAEVWGWQ
jgi:hypothetical protein